MGTCTRTCTSATATHQGNTHFIPPHCDTDSASPHAQPNPQLFHAVPYYQRSMLWRRVMQCCSAVHGHDTCASHENNISARAISAARWTCPMAVRSCSCTTAHCTVNSILGPHLRFISEYVPACRCWGEHVSCQRTCIEMLLHLYTGGIQMMFHATVKRPCCMG